MYQDQGAAIPVLHQVEVALAELGVEHGHQSATTAGRLALCAMALAVVVRVAARMPKGSAERKALARAAAELREVV